MHTGLLGPKLERDLCGDEEYCWPHYPALCAEVKSCTAIPKVLLVKEMSHMYESTDESPCEDVNQRMPCFCFFPECAMSEESYLLL